MENFKTFGYKLLTVIVLVGQLAAALAQKLPKIQTSSVRAPANIKIDGKTTEWNDRFQAYNWGQHIYYTISNDDDNLYLTARMDDILGSRKILKGGITFTILPSVKKAEGLSITFPVIEKSIMDTEEPGGTPLLRYHSLKLKPKTAANKAKIDSLIAEANKNIPKTYKQIYITGLHGVSDLIPIYNLQDIMVGAGYDKNMNYTYELGIPLKYLQAALSSTRSLKYNMKLNVIGPLEMKKILAKPHTVISVAPQTAQPGSMEDMFLLGDTEFSGEYTLAN